MRIRLSIPLLLASLLLACCGPRDQSANVLRVANWGGAGEEGEFADLARKINEDFERKHPGVKVLTEGIPANEYIQKMLLNHIAGAMPDVMVIDASSASVFIDNGTLTDLAPYFEKEKGLKEQYWPEVLRVYSRGTAQYGVPGDFTPMVLYYNKELFDKAGVPYPSATWTREEFRQAAIKLTTKDQFGFAFSNWMPGWVMWLWNGGGDVLSNEDQPRASGTLDSDANAETVEFLRQLIVKDKASPSLSQSAGAGIDYFASGKAAMAVSGHWSLVGYKASKNIDYTKIGVVPMPFDRAGGPRTMGSGSQTVLYMAAYGVPKAAKNKDLAWEYLKHWTSYEVQKKYNASGIAVCARKDVSEEAARRDPREAAFLPIVATGRAPYGSFVPGYAIVEKIGQGAMDTILNNPDRDVKAELSKAAQAIDKEFAKSR